MKNHKKKKKQIEMKDKEVVLINKIRMMRILKSLRKKKFFVNYIWMENVMKKQFMMDIFMIVKFVENTGKVNV